MCWSRGNCSHRRNISVVYAVSGNLNCDPQSRINAFAHVNHRPEAPRVGILLCIMERGFPTAGFENLSVNPISPTMK